VYRVRRRQDSAVQLRQCGGGGGRVARGHRFESLIAFVVNRVRPGRYHSTTVVQNK